jgi:pilus assembly protein CpaE
MRRFNREDNRTGKVLLVTGDREWPERFDRALEYRLELDISHADSTEDPDVLGRITASNAPVIVIGPGYERAEGVALARTLHEQQPDVSVVLIAESSPGLLQEAVHAGVRDVLDPSTSDIVLRGSLTLAIETAGNRHLSHTPSAHA